MGIGECRFAPALFLSPHCQQEFHHRSLEPKLSTTSARHIFLHLPTSEVYRSNNLRRCEFAFISHSERPFPPKQHLNCSNLGLSRHTPLLLPKQGCGLSSTGIFLRCLHSCRSVISDVHSIPIAEASPNGPPRGVIEPATTRINRVHQFIRILGRIEFICPKPDKHGVFQCVHTE
jgi:hypothetical protein